VAARVKICGLTRADDAAYAAAAGASYLGVVLAGGPRQVSLAGAADVVAASRGVPVLGVFGRQSVAEIAEIVRDTGLAGAQLHGAYTDESAARLAGLGLIVWRVLRIASRADLGLLPEPEPQDLSLMCVPFMRPDAAEVLRSQLFYTMGDSDLF
jgi:phosphoribosylanthranilate isomerase